LGRKILDFIDAELKNQVIGLQLATEMELYPENSVITRYWKKKVLASFKQPNWQRAKARFVRRGS
jgi:hypothetical protein